MRTNYSDVIIIGAGPAGIACATQLKRQNINSIIFEKEEIGGLLRNANLIENYPGFPTGIVGSKLVKLLKIQSEVNNLNIKYENVESAEFVDNYFIITTNAQLYNSKYLVIASGTIPIVPKAPVITNDIKENVFFEIYNLGKIKNKKIAINGGGDCAFDYALNLERQNKLIILNRSDKIRALPILQERVAQSNNIKYYENTSVNFIIKHDKQILISCSMISDNILVDYLLIAIGREPNLDFIDSSLLKNSNLFQIGDVKNANYRQTSIAVGDGTFTAMKINSINN